jgi:hypothetical protein
MTDDTTPTAQIKRLLSAADADTQHVIELTLAIEQAKLGQAERAKAAVARDIAAEIRKVLK